MKDVIRHWGIERDAEGKPSRMVWRGDTKRTPPYQKLLIALAKSYRLPAPVFEHRFAPPRRFRFDVAWLDAKVALEINGGIWTGGRHVRGTGYAKDLEKMNLAQSLGWQVYQVAPAGVTDGTAIKWILYALSKERTT